MHILLVDNIAFINPLIDNGLPLAQISYPLVGQDVLKEQNGNRQVLVLHSNVQDGLALGVYYV